MYFWDSWQPCQLFKKCYFSLYRRNFYKCKIVEFSSLNHNALQLVGRQWWSLIIFLWTPALLLPPFPEPKTLSPLTYRPLSSSPFLIFPWLLMSSTPTGPGNLQPNSTGNSLACPPLSLLCWTWSWYLVAFLSDASSQPSSHWTVNSTRIIFLTSPNHMTVLGLREFGLPGGSEVSFPDPLSWCWCGPFSMSQCQPVRTLSWRRLYLPRLRAVLHPASMCAIVPLPLHSLYSGPPLNPHLCRVVGVGRVSYMTGCKRAPEFRHCDLLLRQAPLCPGSLWFKDHVPRSSP